MRRRSRARAAMRLAALLLAEVAAARFVLGALGPDGPASWQLRTPPEWHGQDPLDAAAQIAGIVALAILAYLAVITMVHLVALGATCVPSSRSLGLSLSRLATRTGPRWLTSLAVTATFAGVGVTGCSATPPERPPATMVLETPTPPADTTAPVTMLLDPSRGPDVSAPHQPTAASQSEPVHGAEETPQAPTAPAPPQTVEVLRGDSLWSIAEREVSARLGRNARPSEVRPYWLIIIEMNRSRLVDPSDPDHIYVGQLLMLP